MNLTTFILALAATTVALVAGLFYGYSCSVNPGLGRLPDAEYIAAMQSINRAILNPAFFISFMGSFFLLPLAAYLHRAPAGSPVFLLLCTSAIIYITGAFGTTIFGNVPLNEMLERFDLASASAEEITRTRTRFEGLWNALHQVRTIAVVASLILVIVACISRSAADGQ